MRKRSLTKRKNYGNITKKVTYVATAATIMMTGMSICRIMECQNEPSSFVVSKETVMAGETVSLSSLTDYSSLLSDYLSESEKAPLSIQYEETALMMAATDKTTVFLSQEKIKRDSINQMMDTTVSEAARTADYLAESKQIEKAVDELLTEVEASMRSMDSMLADSRKETKRLAKEEAERIAAEEEAARIAAEEEAARIAAEEEAARIEALASASVSVYNDFYYDVTDAEYNCLLRIVEAEAANQGIIGKILVANVIMNRVANHRFPDSIEGVVFQDNQFSPIDDGRYYSVDIADSTREAVDRALSGEDYSDGALYFTAFYDPYSWFASDLTLLFQEGDHYFYR